MLSAARIQATLKETSQAPASLSDEAVPGAVSALRRHPATQIASGTQASGNEKREPRTCQTLTSRAPASIVAISRSSRRNPFLRICNASTVSAISTVA